MRPHFHDRRDAGAQLAQAMAHYRSRPGLVVLALPRGGVPVGYEVAHALGAPFDIFLVRKLGVPGHRELAMGAIASGGIRVLNDEVIRANRISPAQIETVAAAEERELARREVAYRTGHPALDLAGKIVVLVDDGLATGSTMRAAVDAVRSRRPERIVVAVPVGAVQTCADLGSVADEVVCVVAPESFQAVGQWYVDFSQTSDDEVRALLGPEHT